MASILTYNNLITVFQDVFNRHYQLQAGMFYAGGDLADTEFLKNNQHPILWVKPVSALLIRNEEAGFYPVKTITMDVHCVDLLNTDTLNREEVQSDMHQALNDIVSEIASHPYYQRSQLTLDGDVRMEPLNDWNDRGAFGWKATLNFKLKNPFDFCGLPLEEIQDFSFPGLGMSGLTYSNPFLTCATLVQCDTFQNYQYFGGISGNSASFNVIYLSGVSLTSKFIQIGENISSASTIVTAGTNIYTGGTSLNPVINVVSNPYFNSVNASGNSIFSADLSGGTFYSGSTDLGTVIQSFIPAGTNDITRVKPGSNITTGGTDNYPVVSLVDSPFVNNFNSSGLTSVNLFSGTSISATTFSYLDGNQISGKVLTADDYGNATWQYPSSNGVLTYMFISGVSDSSNYLRMPSLANYTVSTIAFTGRTVTTTPTILSSFITDSGYPNLTVIPAGLVTAHYETQKAAGSNNYYTYFEVYKRDLLGTETLISTSDNTSQSAVNTRVQNTTTATINSATTLSATDRIVTKVYAVMVSSTATITLYFDDNTNARLELPTLAADVTNFIPYTGATSGVDLNNKSLNNVNSFSANTAFATSARFNSASATTLSARTIWVTTLSGMSPINIENVIVQNSGLTASTITITATPYASGGTVTTSAQYTIHSFTSTGGTAFKTNTRLPIEYLIVGGGGGGGGNDRGGGGAGGFISGSTTIAPSTYPVYVGRGGVKTAVDGDNGLNSYIFSIATAIGGAGGQFINTGIIGGSGGGVRTGAVNPGTLGQGQSGGTGPNTGSLPSGGGGGASTPGGDGAGTVGGSGGTGYFSDIRGSMTAYAGGGGGGVSAGGTSGGAGGVGGGGAGATTGNAGTAGTANTGGGGGGGGNSAGDTSSAGGSGIIVIRYPTSALTQSSSYVNAFTSTELGGVYAPIFSANTANFNFGNAVSFSATTLNSTSAGLTSIWSSSATTVYLSATTGSINTLWSATANLANVTGTTSNFQTERSATGLIASLSATTGSINTLWSATGNIASISGTTVAAGTNITAGVGGAGTLNRSVIVNGGSTGLAYFGTQQDSVTKAIMGNSNGASALINGSVLGDLCLRNSQKILISADAGVTSNITIAATGEVTAGIFSATTGSINTLYSSSAYTTFISGSTGILSTNLGVGLSAATSATTLEVFGTFKTTTPTGALGGSITTAGDYVIHTFYSSGTFTPLISGLPVEYLMVGGGGAGGNGGTFGGNGGGGAGGFLTGSTTIVVTGYTITVGSGGTSSTNGGSSVISAINTAIGGGKGGAYGGGNGSTGGSGGGGAGNNGAVGTGGAGTTGQGFSGGSGFNSGTNPTGGGGGGASAPGGNATSTASPGSGGTGVSSSINGTATFYAGGGGGARWNGGGSDGTGGSGGGGNGNGISGGVGGAGTPNTGGGGGGGGSTGGAGGSGIVIIRYLKSYITNTGSGIGLLSIFSDGAGLVTVPTLSSNTITNNTINSVTNNSVSYSGTTGAFTTEWVGTGNISYATGTTSNFTTARGTSSLFSATSATTGSFNTLYGATGNIASISGTTGAFTTEWIGTGNISYTTGTTSNFTTARGTSSLFSATSGTTGSFNTLYSATGNIASVSATTIVASSSVTVGTSASFPVAVAGKIWFSGGTIYVYTGATFSTFRRVTTTG